MEEQQCSDLGLEGGSVVSLPALILVYSKPDISLNYQQTSHENVGVINALFYSSNLISTCYKQAYNFIYLM